MSSMKWECGSEVAVAGPLKLGIMSTGMYKQRHKTLWCRGICFLIFQGLFHQVLSSIPAIVNCLLHHMANNIMSASSHTDSTQTPVCPSLSQKHFTQTVLAESESPSEITQTPHGLRAQSMRTLCGFLAGNTANCGTPKSVWSLYGVCADSVQSVRNIWGSVKTSFYAALDHSNGGHGKY